MVTLIQWSRALGVAGSLGRNDDIQCPGRGESTIVRKGVETVRAVVGRQYISGGFGPAAVFVGISRGDIL